MSTIYSIGARFGGGGIGKIAYYGAVGLHRHGLLHRLLCGSARSGAISTSMIQAQGWLNRGLRKLATYDPTQRIGYATSVVYDHWASRYVTGAQLFHVWANYGLRSLQRARAQGMITVVQRASSHPIYQARLLREEYNRWGLNFRIPSSVLQRAVCELATTDYVLIPSAFVRESFLAEGYSEKKLIEVPFGVDTEHFCPAPSTGTDRPFRALFLGQVGVRKGIPDLLDAWQQLGWHDAELWLVGNVDRDVQPILERYQHLPGLRLVQHIADPTVALQSADLFVFPSIEEGSALVTYEALASGLPVITTPNAGSVITDGVEGRLIPIRNATAIAETLEELRSHDARRRQMAENARQRALSLSWRHSEDSYAEIVKALL